MIPPVFRASLVVSAVFAPRGSSFLVVRFYKLAKKIVKIKKIDI